MQPWSRQAAFFGVPTFEAPGSEWSRNTHARDICNLGKASPQKIISEEDECDRDISTTTTTGRILDDI
jgi:hypothetical protein